MGDLYEIVLSIDLRGDVPDGELAELRWHVGQGPRPGQLLIGADAYLETYPLGDPDDPDCEWETAEPAPMFGQRGVAWRAGGALIAELVRREQPDGWALTVRQELHPDMFYQLRALLEWLGLRAVDCGDGVECFVGYLRFCETTEITPLVLTNGRIGIPADVQSHTPDWQGT
ncbi:hypothetical protein ACIBTZ_21845 [Micromonospora sp. NPDC049460]|uniref:hypothetical protein n=1 Tax=unclassified Micromonospora TaxID=2617518 RepID=UPI00371308E6